MLSNDHFLKILKKYNIGFYCGVPDSTMLGFCDYLVKFIDKNEHIIVSNEGNAISLATGVYLATGTYCLVYLQNAGLGNVINPILSLAAIHDIPLLLLIGWRGEPNIADEPQHLLQGKLTMPILESLEIPYAILANSLTEVEQQLANVVNYFRDYSAPYALIVRGNQFETYNHIPTDSQYSLSREEVIVSLTNAIGEKDIVVSTTGKISRELYQVHSLLHPDRQGQIFLNIGAMGHASSICLGIAIKQPKKQVICLDGDGAILMHLGVLSTIASAEPLNYKHIVINNGSHDSVGGQPTNGFFIDIVKIAQACGYKNLFRVTERSDLENKLPLLLTIDGPALLEVRVKKGSRTNLGRPNTDPVQRKEEFSRFVKS